HATARPSDPLTPYPTLFRSTAANGCPRGSVGRATVRKAGRIAADQGTGLSGAGRIEGTTVLAGSQCECRRHHDGDEQNAGTTRTDRQSTRLNSSHVKISHAV